MTETVVIRDEEGALEAVRAAMATSEPLVDYGVAHAGMGYTRPSRCRVVLREGEVLEHYERDLVVRVSAGCRMERLQSVLGRAGQFVPVDADDDVTVGEVLDHHIYGPLRVGYGTVRDLVLGLSFVDGRGRLIRVGGRTVKNVAGYDVTRLMVGALGEYGMITECYLRCYMRPRRSVVVDMCISDVSSIDGLVNRILVTDASPAWMMMTCDGEMVLRVGYHGTTSACMGQVRSLETLLESEHSVGISGIAEYDSEREREYLSSRRWWRRRSSGLVKLIVPPSSTGFACDVLSRQSSHYEKSHHAGLSHLDVESLPVHGCVHVGGMLNGYECRQLDERLYGLIGRTGGFRVWVNKPPEVSDVIPFSPRQRDWGMLCQLKRVFDPQGILNPGRMLISGEPVE